MPYRNGSESECCWQESLLLDVPFSPFFESKEFLAFSGVSFASIQGLECTRITLPSLPCQLFLSESCLVPCILRYSFSFSLEQTLSLLSDHISKRRMYIRTPRLVAQWTNMVFRIRRRCAPIFSDARKGQILGLNIERETAKQSVRNAFSHCLGYDGELGIELK